MPSPLQTWKHVLLWLVSSQGLSSDARSAVSARVLQIYPPAPSTEFVKSELDEREGELGAPSNYLYLRCPERAPDLQPILSVKWTDDPHVCSLRLRLLLCKQGQDWEQVEGLGFRLEAPEGSVGRHSFFHGQLIKLENANPGSPDWLPDKEPTLPLVAANEVQLVAALAVALYGSEVITTMASEQGLALCISHLREVGDYLRQGATEVKQRQAKAGGKKKGLRR